MPDKPYHRPEPVPQASQLTVLPFVAAVSGLLEQEQSVPGLRITVHRAMVRGGDGYLQQLCPYLPDGLDEARNTAGRIFPVNEGIMGRSFKDGQIWRTKHFDTPESLRAQMKVSMPSAGDDRSLEEVAISYLAVPFVGPGREVVLILYADCREFNFFADERHVHSVVAMCRGFCRLLDSLQKEPFPNVRNFPLQKGRPVKGVRTMYEGVHEPLEIVDPPRFKELRSFNYEAAAA